MSISIAGVFRSLRSVNYRIWAAGALVSNVGTWMQRTAQDWLVFTELTHHNALAVGMVEALQFGPHLLLLPWTGVAADRFNQRKLLMVTQAAMGGLASAPAFAQATAALAETVVTATRTPTRADDLVSDTVIIDRAQIEAQASRTLPEILARVAGVQITANGGPGKASSVFIRGAEARHTLLLVDGVRYGSATTGTPPWENIPVEMIERIDGDCHVISIIDGCPGDDEFAATLNRLATVRRRSPHDIFRKSAITKFPCRANSEKWNRLAN